MKFGLFYIVQWHENRTQQQALQEALEQIELADRLGMDGVWLGEHHFSRHGLLSALSTFAGHVAARTKRIRIGTAVVVTPLHNPILVAEEAGMLDILSGGRLDLGVGSGYQRQEFDGLGVDIEESRERFRESVDVIRKAWTEERLTFHGKYTHVDDLEVMPKPLQMPHPPLYIAVSTTPSSIEFAASQALPIILGGPTATMGTSPQALKTWREQMERFGHPHAHIDPPVAMDIHVAPTVEEAEEDAVGRADFSAKIIAKIGSPIAADGTVPKGYENWANRQKDRELAIESRSRTLRGTPEVVAERLEQVREQGINHVFGFFGFPGLPHEKILRSIEMFAKEVMPKFREEPVRTPG